MRTRHAILGVVMAGVLGAAAQDAAVVGKAAPDFKGVDTKGAEVTLAQHKGKYIVLEWTNYDCPFVKKHYSGGSMQALQADMAATGVVWISVCSSAPGKQGHYPAAKWNELIEQKGVKASAVLLDEDGRIGKLYGANNTPTMYVIDPVGVLVYAGAIDDKPSFDPADIPGAVNYVRQAVGQAMDGKPIEPARTRAYGCTVKY